MKQLRLLPLAALVLANAALASGQPDATQHFYDGSIDQFGYNYFPNHKPLKQSEITGQNLNKLVADIKAGRIDSLPEFHRASVIALRLRKPHLVRDAIGQVIEKAHGPIQSAYQFQGLPAHLLLGYTQADGMVQSLILDDLEYKPTTASLLSRSDFMERFVKREFDSPEQTLVKASSLMGKKVGGPARETLRKLMQINPSPRIGLFYVRANLNGTSTSPSSDDLAVKTIGELVAKHPNDTRVLVLAAYLFQPQDLPRAKSCARLAFKQKDLRPKESALMEKILLKGKR